jgi:hypothetical protein
VSSSGSRSVYRNCAFGREDRYVGQKRCWFVQDVSVCGDVDGGVQFWGRGCIDFGNDSKIDFLLDDISVGGFM